MGMTAAERQKKYRERLKNEDPEKLDRLKKENAERTKQNYIQVKKLPKNVQEEKRKKWREQKQKKVEEDMENYVKFKLVGGKLKLKKGVLPHKFECQKPHKKKIDRPGYKKRQAKEYFERVLSKNIGHEDLLSHSFEVVECENQDSNIIQNSDPLNIPEEIDVISKNNVFEMSCESAVCRACLATDIKMLDLRNTKLQDIFEKLTDNKVGISGNWICYICCSQLQRCHRFLNMVLRADQVLRQLQPKGIQMIPDSLTALRPTHSFLTTPVTCIALPDVELVSVKVEPIDFKEEVLEDIELSGVLKIEDTTEDLMAMCEESYITDDRKIKQTWTQQIDINKKHFEINNKNVPCKHCGKLISEDALKSHLDTHKYICDYCNYKCRGSLVFQRHLRKHTKPFHCNLCKKSFSELSSLRKHKTMHSSKKPYQCDHCNKRFSHKTYLIAHIRTHSPEKPFKCDICFKQFGQTGHLISHKRTHYPKIKKINPIIKQMQKTHKCLVCGKSFAAGNGLNRHMKTHTGQRPYSCEFCFKTFAARDTLKSHVRCHTGEKPFPCNFCDRSFTTSGNLAKHKKTYHSDE